MRDAFRHRQKKRVKQMTRRTSQAMDLKKNLQKKNLQKKNL